MAKTHLTLDQMSLIQPTADVVSCELEGEVILLNLSSGIYYGLNRVGAFIHSQLDRPRRFGEIVEALLERYSIDRATCETQVTEFLEQMVSDGLISVTSDGSNSASISASIQ